MESGWINSNEPRVKEGYLKMLEQGLEELVAGYGEQAQHLRALISGTIAVEKALHKEQSHSLPSKRSGELPKPETDSCSKESPGALCSEFNLLKEALERCEEQKDILSEEKREVSAKIDALKEVRKLQERLEIAENDIERLEAENAELHAQLYTVRKSRDSYLNHSSALLKEKIRLTQQVELLKEMTLMSLQSAKEPKRIKSMSKYLVPNLNSPVSPAPSTPERDFINMGSTTSSMSIGRHSLHQNPYFASSESEMSYYYTPRRSKSALSSPVQKKGRKMFTSGIGRSPDMWDSMNRAELASSFAKLHAPSDSPSDDHKTHTLGSLNQWVKENQTSATENLTENSEVESTDAPTTAEPHHPQKPQHSSKSKEISNARLRSDAAISRVKKSTENTAKSSAGGSSKLLKHLGKSARESSKESGQIKPNYSISSFSSVSAKYSSYQRHSTAVATPATSSASNVTPASTVTSVSNATASTATSALRASRETKNVGSKSSIPSTTSRQAGRGSGEKQAALTVETERGKSESAAERRTSLRGSDSGLVDKTTNAKKDGGFFGLRSKIESVRRHGWR